MTLKNRIEEIYKNYTFCEKNCILNEILFKDKRVTCNCTIKNNIDAKNLNFDLGKYDVKIKNQNFKMMKCVNAFSSLKDNLGNLGFWIFLVLMILNIILLIILFLNIKLYKKYLSREMAEYGYIPKMDEGHIFCHNYIKKLDKLMLRLKEMKNNFNEKMEKNANPPPKHKSHVVTVYGTDYKNKKKRNNPSKVIKTKEDVQKDIELLKSRMDKTKKNKSRNYKKTVDGINTNKGDQISKSGLLTKNTKTEETKTKEFQLNLININIKDLKNQTCIPQESKHILNIYNFEEAKKYDKRKILDIYYIFLIAKQSIMHAFFYKSPLEPLPLRLSLLKFIFGCDLALNAIFYTDSQIYKKYKSLKNMLLLAFTNNLYIIFISFLIGFVLLTIFMHLNNTTNEIRRLFLEEENKIKKDSKYKVSLQRKKEIINQIKIIIKKFKIKVIIFYIFEFLFMIFFWYYTTIFCYIYNKTQLSWLLDSLLTIFIRIILDFIVNLILALLYTTSISSNINCLYSTMVFIYCFS